MESKTIYSYNQGAVRGHGTLVCIDYESFSTTEKAMKFSLSDGNFLWIPKAALKEDGNGFELAKWFKFSDGNPFKTFAKNSYVIN
jgi:hypothetical protein